MTNAQDDAATLREVADYLRSADAAVLARFGIEIGEIAQDRAVLTLTVGASLTNSRGICHGGVLFTLADTAMIYALLSRNQSCVTLNAGITYLRPANLHDVLTARASVVSQGRQTGACEVTITNQRDQSIARAQASAIKHGRPLLE